ncbi:Uncharacterised protein [Halioglobus japonicus]|nr:Uncharacterised protein [Halioglobus japonicus]
MFLDIQMTSSTNVSNLLAPWDRFWHSRHYQLGNSVRSAPYRLSDQKRLLESFEIAPEIGRVGTVVDPLKNLLYKGSLLQISDK